MDVPTFDTLIDPLLRVLEQQTGPIRAATARDLVAKRLQVPQEVREQMLPSGKQAIFDNRAGWAHDRLKRAGLSESARRGYWQLTDKGRQFAHRHASGIPEALLTTLAKPNDGSKVPKKHGATAQAAATHPAVSPRSDELTQSPQERLEAAFEEMTQQLASELLEQVQAVDPGFFEALVLDLLHAMGYGVSRGDLRQVGMAGDGGVDGIVNLDKLGLQKVYVQAKRYKTGNGIGGPEIQGFYGALAMRKATYGVFITTSHFTKHAAAAARSLSDTIVLIDGERLVRLMIAHDVGVSPVQVFQVKRLDSDYFADE